MANTPTEHWKVEPFHGPEQCNGMGPTTVGRCKRMATLTISDGDSRLIAVCRQCAVGLRNAIAKYLKEGPIGV